MGLAGQGTTGYSRRAAWQPQLVRDQASVKPKALFVAGSWEVERKQGPLAAMKQTQFETMTGADPKPARSTTSSGAARIEEDFQHHDISH